MFIVVAVGLMYFLVGNCSNLSGCAMFWPLSKLRVELAPLLVSYMSGFVLL